MLRRPRVGSTRPSVSSTIAARNASSTSLSKMNSNSVMRPESRGMVGGGGGLGGNNGGGDVAPDADADEHEIMHPVAPRSQVAMLPPVLSQEIDEHPLFWLGFEDDAILTSCKRGMFVVLMVVFSLVCFHLLSSYPLFWPRLVIGIEGWAW